MDEATRVPGLVAKAVNLLEGSQRVEHDAGDDGRRRAAAPGQEILEAHPLDVVEDDERLILVRPGVDDAVNVRVPEPLAEPGLAAQRRLSQLLLRRVLPDDLQGEEAVEPAGADLAARVDGAHPPLGDARGHLVVADTGQAAAARAGGDLGTRGDRRRARGRTDRLGRRFGTLLVVPMPGIDDDHVRAGRRSRATRLRRQPAQRREAHGGRQAAGARVDDDDLGRRLDLGARDGLERATLGELPQVLQGLFLREWREAEDVPHGAPAIGEGEDAAPSGVRQARAPRVLGRLGIGARAGRGEHDVPPEQPVLVAFFSHVRRFGLYAMSLGGQGEAAGRGRDPINLKYLPPL